jgi:hypothetical protein
MADEFQCKKMHCHQNSTKKQTGPKGQIFSRSRISEYQESTGPENLSNRVIGLDMTENRIFTLCRMIT